MTGEVTCSNKARESVVRVLAGCAALAWNKYVTRHNAALKILFFEILQDLDLVDTVPPWYSPLKAKTVYEANNAQSVLGCPSICRASKKLEPTELMLALSTTSQSES